MRRTMIAISILCTAMLAEEVAAQLAAAPGGHPSTPRFQPPALLSVELVESNPARQADPVGQAPSPRSPTATGSAAAGDAMESDHPQPEPGR